MAQRAARLIEAIATAALVFASVALISLAAVYFYVSKDLPQLSAIQDYKPKLVSEVFDKNGVKVGEFWDECRYLVPLESIPPLVRNAFIASEDARFWDHPGVDWRSIVRAFFKNLKAGHVVEGASTITQQVTRSMLLSPEKSFKRKVKEAILATKIEKNFSKQQILYLYLNQIYLGNRAYGVKAAARNYFHKELDQLSLGEIALIAGMPSAPSYFSPFSNPKDALERREHVLERLVENGFASKADVDKARSAPLTVYRAGLDKDHNAAGAPYFTEHVRRAIKQKYGDQLLYNGGLKIYTTLDLGLNKIATQSLHQGMWDLAMRQGYRGPIGKMKNDDEIKKFAATVHKEISGWDYPIVIPATAKHEEAPTPLKTDELYQGVLLSAATPGQPVPVLVGNRRGTIPTNRRPWQTLAKGSIVWVRLLEPVSESANVTGSYGDTFAVQEYPKVEGAFLSYEPHNGKVVTLIGGYDFRRSEFNRAVQASRQPGSSFKPFVYAAALDKGFTLSTVIDDSPAVFHQEGAEPWAPKNYENKYNGPVPLRFALAHSLNLVTAKIMQRIGPHYVVAYARKLGILSPMYKYLSIALGAADLNLQEMVTAYGVFANGGIRPELKYITKIVDAEGTVLEEDNPADVTYPAPNAFSADKSTDFNGPLLDSQQDILDREKINLKPYEKKILYGRQIPDGYVMTPQTAYLMTTLLQEVINSGTGVRAKELGRPAAGKTGTTNDETDTWFIGFTPQLLTGVWIGFDSKKHLGKGETGGHTALPVWLSYMKQALADKPIAQFEPPADMKIADINTIKGGSAQAAGQLIQWDTNTAAPDAKSAQDRALDFMSQDL